MRAAAIRSWWVFRAALVVGVCLACRAEDRVAPEQPRQAHSQGPQTEPRLERLVEQLRQVQGEFVLSSDSTWSFSGGSPVFQQLAVFGDDAVARLVACIGDTRPAAATVSGRPAYTGVMCYEALRRFVYYEHWDDRIGGYSPHWPGYLEPDAPPARLREAQREWEKAVAEGAYNIA